MTAAEWHEWVLALSKTELGRDYRSLLGRGGPVYEDLMSFCGVYSPNLAETAEKRAEYEGRRQVGLYIMHMLQEVQWATRPENMEDV